MLWLLSEPGGPEPCLLRTQILGERDDKQTNVRLSARREINRKLQEENARLGRALFRQKIMEMHVEEVPFKLQTRKIRNQLPRRERVGGHRCRGILSVQASGRGPKSGT